MTVRSRTLVLALSLLALASGPVAAGSRHRPDVVLVIVDTLRADRVSCYGYARETTPHVDRLLSAGVRFDEARTVEPLTAPSMVSIMTSLAPQEHGTTRNGLRMLDGLASLPKALKSAGYRTAAFVGNWTLRDKLTGLGAHFDRYEETLNRRRWFGLLRSEADASDLTDAVLEWASESEEEAPDDPWFLWVHYTDPHAPYRLQDAQAAELGIDTAGRVDPADRYDTEIRFVDDEIGRLFDGLDRARPGASRIVVFAADHGESLGEHDYWGHGRNLFEETLRIPLGITWRGRIRPGAVDAPAVNLDIAPTLLGLLGLSPPSGFGGFDWTPVLLGRAEPDRGRVTRYQTHRGAVISRHESDRARRKGLLEVGILRDGKKETFRLDDGTSRVFDLASDPRETRNLAGGDAKASAALRAWVRSVVDELARLDAPVEPIDAESAAQLRSLGYVD